AYVMRPDLFGGRDCIIEIEIAGEASMGRTLVDWRGRSDEAANANAKAIDEIDADGFFALLTERLARLPTSAPSR
ncbi:MAG: hypothetical protein ACR2RE_05925, partial [Geminicoccaceae bacterium]